MIMPFNKTRIQSTAEFSCATEDDRDQLVQTNDVSTDNDHRESPVESKGSIIVLHGLGCNSWVTWVLAQRLRGAGYNVANWGYWSIGNSLPNLVKQFTPRFEEFHDQHTGEGPLHVVTHSMGGIIARGVFAEISLPKIERLVMLCPPNRGSHVATKLGPRLVWLSQAVIDLADGPESFVNQLPPITTAEIGVVAAAADFVVKEGSTHHPGEIDHIVMPGTHSEVLFRKDVADQVLHFLDIGQFQHAEELAATPAKISQSAIEAVRNDSLVLRDTALEVE